MDWQAIYLSLKLATVVSVALLIIGVPLAYWLTFSRWRWKFLFESVVALPLVLPPTVLGAYLLVVIGRASPFGRVWEGIFGEPLVFTWKAAVVAALLHSLPLLVKSARAAFESVDRRYERAARTLGASEWRLFWRVTLPLAQRSIFAAAALAFARALGDFGVTLMVAGNIPGSTQTVAVAIYDAVEGGNTAVARMLVLVVSVVALSILTLAKRLEPR